METGLVVELSLHEQSTLLRIANGDSRGGTLPRGHIKRLVSLALIEDEGPFYSLTALGERWVQELRSGDRLSVGASAFPRCTRPAPRHIEGHVSAHGSAPQRIGGRHVAFRTARHHTGGDPGNREQLSISSSIDRHLGSRGTSI